MLNFMTDKQLNMWREAVEEWKQIAKKMAERAVQAEAKLAAIREYIENPDYWDGNTGMTVPYGPIREILDDE